MDGKIKEIIKNIETELTHIDKVSAEDIPGIDLYMDQVLSFLEKNLDNTRRHEDDKVVTKTMINNYAKNKLLPPPEKKKYSKDHILMLVFIYYFKNVLSLEDIRTLLTPISEKYFHADSQPDLSALYSSIFDDNSDTLEHLKEDLNRAAEKSVESVKDLPQDDRRFLQFFSMICSLTFDVYLRKHAIEKLIDTYLVENKTEL